MSRVAPTAPSLSRVAPWLVFAAALALSALRAPVLLSEPRFWAEEATDFYAAAHVQPWPASLFFLPPHTVGYLLLSASGPATVAARWLPVASAPAVTTWAAFCVLAVALALVCFGRSLFWDTPLRRAAACAAILLAPSSLGEVWLNSTNSQVYCGVIALCLLCEDTRAASRARMALYAGLLLLCGLSGVYAALLVFAFAWKAWLERTPGAFILLGVNLATASVQALVFGWLWSGTSLRASRFEQLDWVRSATNAFYQQFLVPLGLRPLVRAFGDPLAVLASLAHEPRAPLIVALALGGALGAALIVALLVERDLRSPRNLLVIALPSLVLLTTLSAKHGRASGRYAVVSGVTLLFLLLAHARFGPGVPRWRPALAAGLLGWSLAVGATGFRSDDAFHCPGGCPRWRDEVARWCREPSYAPQVWPVRLPPTGPQWRVRLPPSLTSRACPATRRDRPAAGR
jgi:hypothetical protein